MNDDIEVDFNASDNETTVFRKIRDEYPIINHNTIAITNVLKTVTRKKNSYFIIVYKKSRLDEIKTMIEDRILILNKISYNEQEYMSVLQDSKNVYFTFLDFDKKMISAIMKKEYITPDKNLKLETKSKQEIYFTELIRMYRIPENELITLLSGEVNDKIRMVNFFNLVSL
jgi:hypothetical protein